MITELDMYLITRLNYIKGFMIICLLISIAFWFVYLMETSEEGNIIKFQNAISKLKSIGAPIVIVCSLGIVFIPSMKEMCAIKVIPAIVNNENVKSIGNEAMQYAVDWLKELNQKNKK